MKEIEIFKEIASDPYKYADEWNKRTGKRVIGYLCSYAPEEVIYAADALPMRLINYKSDISKADAYLQSYSCSLVRGCLEEVLTEELNFLSGALFPHTCDSIQRLSDIWRLNAGLEFHFDYVLPVKLDTKSAHDYMADILKKLVQDMSKKLDVTISDEKLKNASKLFNKIRKNLHDIYMIKSRRPDIITGRDIYDIIKTSMVMDRDELLPALESLVAVLKEKEFSAGEDKRKRIVISGGLCTHPDIYSIIESLDGVTVWDDLCTGGRLFEGEIKDTGNPIKDLAERYRERVVCPAKFSGTTSRGDNLMSIVKEHKADGVIFLILKFCDPHGFDYPYLKGFLEKENIPNMLLELEETPGGEGQLLTRIETFIDML